MGQSVMEGATQAVLAVIQRSPTSRGTEQGVWDQLDDQRSSRQALPLRQPRIYLNAFMAAYNCG